MKNIKVFIDGILPAPEGWVSIQEFEDFQNLLETVPLDKIDVISFGYYLNHDGIVAYNGVDCAVCLIQAANGNPLPECVSHCETDVCYRAIACVIEHYNHSYKHGESMPRVFTEKVA
jgi:hypothetical protein